MIYFLFYLFENSYFIVKSFPDQKFINVITNERTIPVQASSCFKVIITSEYTCQCQLTGVHMLSIIHKERKL